MAHEEMVRINKISFIKDMIYRIGSFKVRAETEYQSSARKANIFLMPLLTGIFRNIN
jgi:hypothetical protein